jgi:glycosyltransferase involved in cell wall biosynthesis
MELKTICVGNKLSENYFYKFNLRADHILAAGVDEEVFFKKESVEKIYDLIFVGTFSELKGVDLLCDAIKSSRQDHKWCFIGTGPYSEKLMKMSEEFNIDVFAGLKQNEIADKLNQSKYFILLSRSEGFPLASLEALYCGVPVICSDLDQFKEQVKDNYNGFIINSSDINRINESITQALSVEERIYKELSYNASVTNKEFSLKRVCEELMITYKNKRI